MHFPKFPTVKKVLQQRLHGAIDSLSNEKESYANDSNQQYVVKANDALKNETQFANDFDFEMTWNQIHIAEQLLFYRTDSQNGLSGSRWSLFLAVSL
ncbi:MAG: hypothetical protein ABI723_24140 [Bacteroidia bacterium]